MRRPMLIVLLVAISIPASADTRQTYISIGADALRTVYDVTNDDHAAMSIAMMNNRVVVLRIDAQGLGPLSEAMHEQRHRCGGFMAHASLSDAFGALAADAP